jgi:P4 family phage/plasmid primase-like protien
LKKTNDKNNIMREAMELFYDKDFIKCMDTNKFLMCFNNGVVDFKNKIFRDGYPQDYITKTTGIRYEIFDEKDTKQQELSREIISLMEKLFPIHSLNQYMWDHLSSSLIGINRNQTFNIYRGSGSNGKSMLTSLMSLSFGEYKGVVPIGLVTEKRVNIGGTSSEIIQLKGIRYAVMQEPSKATKMNEGIMKELTGGDPLQGRALYNESETFDPQFNLVVCTNHLFDIQSNDDGTWRRIRICDFLSKFIDENEKHTDNTPYVFPKDKELEGKLPIYAPVFMSMLVKRVFETDGIVKDCDIVTQASNKYRQEQDVIAGFLDEMIIKTGVSKDKIKKQELVQHFRIWYQQEQQNGKLPKSQEIYDVMDKKFGTYKKTGGWQGVKIKYMEEGDEMEEI